MFKLRESRLFECMKSLNIEELRDVCYQYVTSGKDINVRDIETGEGYLHCLCDLKQYLMDENGVSILYLLGCNGLDMDIQDNKGETFLHRVVRIHGAHRALETAIRCGADIFVKDNSGRTAEDVLLEEKPSGWQEMLHWWNKYRPGIYRAMVSDRPNIPLIESLLKSWCSVSVKSLSTRIKELSEHSKELKHILEKYKHCNTVILAALSGHTGFFTDVFKRTEQVNGANVNLNLMNPSYQRTMDSPEVSLPVLLYTWTMDNLPMSELLLNHGANPSILFTWGTEPVKPLFFQLVCAKSKPCKEIIYRTLQRANINARDYRGQTVLFEAVRHRASKSLVKFLLKRGINVAVRDQHGQTARDYARALDSKGKKYTKLIDQHVVTMVTEGDVQGVETLILQGYHSLKEVGDNNGSLVMLAKLSRLKSMVDVVERYEDDKEHIDIMLETAKNGRLADLRPLLCRRFMSAVDICGRNVCHIAVVYNRPNLIQCICDHYSILLNKQDNLGRTPYHYAQALLSDKELLQYMEDKGADTESKDVLGRTPSDYKCTCDEKELYVLKNSITNYAMDVYVVQTNFRESMIKSIKAGNLEQVTSLITGLKNQSKHSTEYINRYSDLLFMCIENRQEDIAMYLLNEGIDTQIFKQYTKCDLNNSDCVNSCCNHKPVSLQDVASQNNCHRVLMYLDELSKQKIKDQGRLSTLSMTFSQFGLI